MPTESESEAFERGKREGKTEQRLDDHDAHLNRINGSIKEFAAATAELAKEVSKFGDEARLDRERVRVAADTLAKVTEEKRDELEAKRIERADALQVKSFEFTRKHAIIALLVAILLGIATLVLRPILGF